MVRREYFTPVSGNVVPYNKLIKSLALRKAQQDCDSFMITVVHRHKCVTTEQKPNLVVKSCPPLVVIDVVRTCVYLLE